MVLTKTIKILLRAIFFMSASILFSCEEVLFIDCQKCLGSEPADVYIEVALNHNLEGVGITIYKGTLENGIIIGNYDTFSKNSFYRVTLNNNYTIVAEYSIKGKTYKAVNTIMPKVTFDEDSCSDPCYYVYNDKVQLRLKYSD
ncbi:MAG TPA: hypothetical protein PKI12_03575 [Bacteroidales bacterium]|nr:hypothetical protein [Bacteroidales bacterium]